MQDALLGHKSKELFTVNNNFETENLLHKKTQFNLGQPLIQMPEAHEISFVIDKKDTITTDVKNEVEKKQSNELSLLLSNIEILIKHNELALAKPLIYKALSIDSKNIFALKKLGSLLTNNEELDQLIKVQSIICEQDYNFETVSRLAHSLYKKGDDKKAFEKYLEAISIVMNPVPELFEVYKCMGNILTKEKDFDGAEEYYNRAYELNSKSDVLFVNLGTLDLQCGNINQALERFRNALEINPENDKAWVGLALVHQQMGDEPLAYANVENAIDINPANRTAVHIFANWSVKFGRITEALEKIENYLSSVAIDEEMSLVFIHLLCQQNKFDLALLEVERVLLWNPKNEEFVKIEKEIQETQLGGHFV